MLASRELTALALITATLATASACLNSFAVVQPTYIRYKNIPIRVALTYDPSRELFHTCGMQTDSSLRQYLEFRCRVFPNRWLRGHFVSDVRTR
jgi:hypothetical protein